VTLNLLNIQYASSSQERLTLTVVM